MAIQEAGLNFLEKSLTNGRAIPGQSLTNSKDQPQNWESPPRHTDPREAMYAVFNSLIEPSCELSSIKIIFEIILFDSLFDNNNLHKILIFFFSFRVGIKIVIIFFYNSINSKNPIFYLYY